MSGRLALPPVPTVTVTAKGPLIDAVPVRTPPAPPPPPEEPPAPPPPATTKYSQVSLNGPGIVRVAVLVNVWIVLPL